MPRTRECDYCGADIEPGTGTMFVRKSGTTIHYCSSKCENNADLGREARNLEWTEAGRETTAAEQEAAAEAEAEAAAEAADEQTADEADADEDESAEADEAADEDDAESAETDDEETEEAEA
ncbi:50S ribosomal protein L24e [Halomicrobium sp. IBSBa]|uniref:50S ribosomal protein L24e n=1 Tax=Halomicrobium sp. IBSBa TaxID=2778916 RepID=UPI001ABF11E9|nr:50S ribosomal protein L24e [Halomicrobium sp. IBSBa]MBO4246436.1 50S ribosomal protein L24e [Halomicrobium sp. IBSBa]